MANSMWGLTPEQTAEMIRKMQEAKLAGNLISGQGAKSKAVRPAGMNPRSRALPSYVPPKQETPLPANANNSPDRSPSNPPPIPVQDLGYPPHASGALGQAPSYQDQSMKPHLGSAFPVDGKVQGTNPNAVDPMMGDWNPMMGGDETAGQPSMMDKIMGYKPDMGMQQLFEATGKAFGNPLIGVAPSAGGTSIGGEYSNLNPAYAEKKRTKLAADKLREQEESQENDKRQYIKMGLESGAITPKHAQRLMALKGGLPKGIKDIIDAKTFGNVDNLGTYKGGRILTTPTKTKAGSAINPDTGKVTYFTQEQLLEDSTSKNNMKNVPTDRVMSSNTQVQDAKTAMKYIKESATSTGIPAQLFGWIYGSDAKTLSGIYEKLNGTAAIDNAIEMRQKAGSNVLGQITKNEFTALGSKYARFDISMNAEEQKVNLKRFMAVQDILVHGLSEGAIGKRIETDGQASQYGLPIGTEITARHVENDRAKRFAKQGLNPDTSPKSGDSLEALGIKRLD